MVLFRGELRSEGDGQYISARNGPCAHQKYLYSIHEIRALQAADRSGQKRRRCESTLRLRCRVCSAVIMLVDIVCVSVCHNHYVQKQNFLQAERDVPTRCGTALRRRGRAAAEQHGLQMPLECAFTVFPKYVKPVKNSRKYKQKNVLHSGLAHITPLLTSMAQNANKLETVSVFYDYAEMSLLFCLKMMPACCCHIQSGVSADE